MGESERLNLLRQFAAPELLPVLTSDDEAARRLHSGTRVLDSFARLAVRHGAGFSVVLLPYKLQVLPSQRREWIDRLGLSPSQLFRPQQGLRRWASDRGVSMVDVTGEFLRHPEPQHLFWPIDLRLSPAGHIAVAEALAGESSRTHLEELGRCATLAASAP
jgi:hypothetical protein